MSVLIAIDQGTTSTRAVAFDKDLNIIHSEQKEYPLIYPNDGWVEIEPNVYWILFMQRLILSSVLVKIFPLLE